VLEAAGPGDSPGPASEIGTVFSSIEALEPDLVSSITPFAYHRADGDQQVHVIWAAAHGTWQNLTVVSGMHLFTPAH
jgi:hypothetical protein